MAGLRDAGVVPGLATVLVGSPAEVAVYRALDSLKDIEVAVHPVNAGLLTIGRPRYVVSTPAAAFHMFDRYLVGSDRDPAEFYSRSNASVRRAIQQRRQAGRLAGVLAEYHRGFLRRARSTMPGAWPSSRLRPAS